MFFRPLLDGREPEALAFDFVESSAQRMARLGCIGRPLCSRRDGSGICHQIMERAAGFIYINRFYDLPKIDANLDGFLLRRSSPLGP